MLPARRPDPLQFAVRQAEREITLWTTKDGREIPLDEMSDDHIANALRVLTLWRSRLKMRDTSNPIVNDLGDAIDRFKRIMRQRRKAVAREVKKAAKGDTSGPVKIAVQRR